MNKVRQGQASGKGSTRSSIKNTVVSQLFSSLFFSKLIQCTVLTILGLAFAIRKKHWVYFALPLCMTAFYIKTLIFEFFVLVHVINQNLGTFKWHTKIDDNLYLGAIPFVDPHLSTFQKTLRVKAVLSINETFELTSHTLFGPVVRPAQWIENGIHHKQLSSPDFFPPSFDLLDKGAAYVNYHLTEGRTVYVHCKSGIGRSASVIIAYLMKYKRLSVHEAFSTVKVLRGEIFSVNSAQLRNMVQYENFLKSGGSSSQSNSK